VLRDDRNPAEFASKAVIVSRNLGMTAGSHPGKTPAQGSSSVNMPFIYSIHGIRFAFLRVQWKLLETVKGEKCMFMETGGVVFLPIFTVATGAFESPPLGQLATLRFRYLHFCSAHRTQ